MKLTDECYHCLKRLVVHAAQLATEDNNLRPDVENAGMRMLDKHYSKEDVSIVVASKIHHEIKKVSGNNDPYRQIKDREIALARTMFEQAKSQYDDTLADLMKLAVLGNSIDFFKPVETISEKDINEKIEFYIDDTGRFEAKLEKAKKVLYLADNSGEVFFDIPLIKYIGQITEIKYVVKALPVQNDLTLEEIRIAGVEDDIVEIIDTGTATPGIDFAQASREFIEEFENADLILAKGMGYYESLTELPAAGRVFHCFRAKCRPVADSAGVPVDSFVAMLR
jgi:damage-control phosphatase, subfamily I